MTPTDAPIANSTSAAPPPVADDRGWFERFSTQNPFILAISLACFGFGLAGVAVGVWAVGELGVEVRGSALAALGGLVALTGLWCFWVEWAEGEQLGWLDSFVEKVVMAPLGSSSVLAAWSTVGAITMLVGAVAFVASAVSTGALGLAPVRDLTFGLACAGLFFSGPRVMLVVRKLRREGA